MPIPVYSASPIHAAKPSGVTPQTAQPEEGQRPQAATTTAAPTGSHGYPPAQPGARPSMPVTTGVPQPFSNVMPTPTQNIHGISPPAPQPGAVPVAPGVTSHIPPPPPKAGETMQQPPPTATAPLMPAQMSYPVPDVSYSANMGASTTTVPPPAYANIPRPAPLQSSGPASSFSHPPGYHQNANASEFNSDQRAAHNAFVSQNSSIMPTQGQDGDPGVWDTAKKWAAAAGDSLASAEQEVWKRINKD